MTNDPQGIPIPCCEDDIIIIEDSELSDCQWGSLHRNKADTNNQKRMNPTEKATLKLLAFRASNTFLQDKK